ncbi:MAG: aspartate/glutamate racemase family protein [Burkholderiaceae bacterium]|nr:aspartate/glutamate racemase family protein [Burkholderiaceae bacterium]
MHTVLVINPNTTVQVTDTLLRHLGGSTPQRQLQGATAAFGAPYIADEASYCIAGHAVLEAWAQRPPPPGGAYSAVLVGCFGDPGVDALREVAQRPVLGLAEVSLQALQHQGRRRIAVVTGGAAWQPMLERWCRATGYAPGGGRSVEVCAIATLPQSGIALMQSPEQAVPSLVQACTAAARNSGADAVLIGGAGLAGLGALVRPQVDFPVIDSVEAARWWLDTLAAPGTSLPGAGCTGP